MNKLKKFAGILLALVMCFGLTCTAFAADTYTISLASDSEGYTYVVYQIFTGDLSSDGKTLSNVVWGSSMTAAAESALETKYNATGAAAVAEAITSAQDLADALASYTSSMTAVGTLDDTTTSLSVAAGYYLIVNTAVPSGDYGYSDYIVQVVSDLTIAPKNTSTPDFDKTVGEESTNDATADYAVGDSVPFTLTATLADSYSAYDSYKLVFTDILSDGLTYDTDSLKVTIGEVDITESCTVSASAESQTITVTINDLKAIDEANDNITLASGSKIVVSYTATLNEDASSIENNTATLNFSNNPNSDSTGTTDDKVYVVTFTVKVNKVDGDEQPLKGAGFTLYKYDEETNEYESTGTVLTVDENGTTFTIDGLAEGSYKLVESTTPDGYNTIDPIEFTIAATVVEDATETDGVDVDITPITDFTISGETLTTTVKNQAGSSLPTTGGIGTTIFYVVGGALVIGAVVLLITKKRMSE